MKQAAKHIGFALLLAGGIIAATPQADAASCVNGVYRAGCVGPRGAAVVHKYPSASRPRVTCANGVHRAGCVGPNGAAVVRKPY
jgi:hypothetical protein